MKNGLQFFRRTFCNFFRIQGEITVLIAFIKRWRILNSADVIFQILRKYFFFLTLLYLTKKFEKWKTLSHCKFFMNFIPKSRPRLKIDAIQFFENSYFLISWGIRDTTFYDWQYSDDYDNVTNTNRLQYLSPKSRADCIRQMILLLFSELNEQLLMMF